MQEGLPRTTEQTPGGESSARCRRSASHRPASGDAEVPLGHDLRSVSVQVAEPDLAGGPLEVVGAPDDLEPGIAFRSGAAVFDVAQAPDLTVEVSGPLTERAVSLELALTAVATDTVVAILRIEHLPLVPEPVARLGIVGDAQELLLLEDLELVLGHGRGRGREQANPERRESRGHDELAHGCLTSLEDGALR